MRIHRSWASAPIGAAAALLVAAACKDPTPPAPSTVFKATLRVDNEVPDTATTGRNAAGNVTVTYSGGTLSYTLNVTTAPASPITAAHIHAPAAAGATAAVRVNLCGATGVPACPTGSGTVTGSNSSVIGMSMDSLLVLMRSYQSYVNVHTQAQPGGLMRGQLLPQP
jgi:hypothetical protein